MLIQRANRQQNKKIFFISPIPSIFACLINPAVTVAKNNGTFFAVYNMTRKIKSLI
jgi:hypothetical protein